MCLAASCSMDSDTTSSDVTASLGSGDQAAISLQLSVGGIGTKAETVSNPGNPATQSIADTKTISNCSVIILKGSNVLSATDNVSVDATTQLATTQFYVKKQSDNSALSVMVIANTTATFSDCTNLTSINAKIQKTDDLAKLPKIGTSTITVTNFYRTMAEATANPTTIEIVLHQLAASVVLDAFTVTDESFGTTNPKNVTVNKVTLLNIHNNCKTILDSDNSGSNVATGDANTSSTPKVLNLPVFTYDKATNTKTSSPLTEGNGYFFTFPSVDTQDASAVAMQVDYTVGDQSFSKVYKIKHDTNTIGVRSGYLYKLKMNMTLKSDEIYFKVTCYTLDWNYNQLSVNLEEI